MSIRKKNRRTDIFATLRDRVVYLEYPPGMPLIEKDLCDEFRVSRTPLREAIRKLEEMNLATVLPRYGTHVAAIDINEIRCAFEVKIRLEGLAAAPLTLTRPSSNQGRTRLRATSRRCAR